jgi:hypothetical protein
MKQLSRLGIQRMIDGGGSGGSGGGSVGGGETYIPSLGDLRDTLIEDPQDEDIIEYDEDQKLWVNAKKSIPWTGVRGQIINGNQFNIVDESPTGNKLYINAKTRDGSNLSTAITDIYFYNGANAMTGMTVHAQNFLAEGSVTALSDERLKEILHPVGIRIEDIANAPIVAFRWKDGDGEVHIGSIAQHWQKIVPELTPTDNDGRMSMDYATIALMSAVSLARKVEELEKKIEELEKKHKEV